MSLTPVYLLSLLSTFVLHYKAANTYHINELNLLCTRDCSQGTLQKFLDDLFQAILSIPPEKPPLAVKYFFDFLEEQAGKRGITDQDTLHIWKTNRYKQKEES